METIYTTIADVETALETILGDTINDIDDLRSLAHSVTERVEGGFIITTDEALFWDTVQAHDITQY